MKTPLCVAKPKCEQCLGLLGRIVEQIMLYTTLKAFNLGKTKKEYLDFKYGQ